MRSTTRPRFRPGKTRLKITITAAPTFNQPITVSQKDSVLIWFSASIVKGMRLNPLCSGVPSGRDMMTSS